MKNERPKAFDCLEMKQRIQDATLEEQRSRQSGEKGAEIPERPLSEPMANAWKAILEAHARRRHQRAA